jgi:putative copper resistance protein D
MLFAGCIGALAAATSFAWIGHVHALHAPVLPSALIGIHLLGAGFWVGALGPLYLIAGDDVPRQTARAAERFGRAALVVVGVMLVAGVVLLTLLLPSFSALWNLPYGRLILGKTGLVAALLALAAFNHGASRPGCWPTIGRLRAPCGARSASNSQWPAPCCW